MVGVWEEKERGDGAKFGSSLQMQNDPPTLPGLQGVGGVPIRAPRGVRINTFANGRAFPGAPLPRPAPGSADFDTSRTWQEGSNLTP